MPGVPLVTRETIQSRSGDQQCRQDSRLHLSAEEEIAAEDSLTAYCKPVEFYNCLRWRSVKNPSFLQRCLCYKLQAKHHKRIQMTVSLSETFDDGLQIQSLMPMHIILARLLSDVPNSKQTAVYHCTRVRTLSAPTTEEGGNVARSKFLLPEMDKLVREAKSGSLFILFVSYAKSCGSTGFDLSRDRQRVLSFPLVTEKLCLWGKISMESLFLSWEKFPEWNRGGSFEMLSTVDLHSCILKPSFANEGNRISFQMPQCSSSGSTLPQIQVTISAQEGGAKEKSPYTSSAYNNIPALSSHVLGLRSGNVIFNYRYYHNQLQKTEVTEDFTCPICLIKCTSFKGMKLHLPAFHDLFNFEFWESDEYRAVNVSIKTEPWRFEIFSDGNEMKQQIFAYCFKPLKRKQPIVLLDQAMHIQPLTLPSDTAATGSDMLCKADDAYSSGIERARSSSVNESLNGVADPDCIQSNIPGSSITPPAMLQFAKTRKLSERSDSRSRALLEKRQFFHSHRAQPMQLEQVLSDHDSEDEVDDDVADLEDRRMLDDFVDVSREEKQIMHLWNSFVRRNRVLADGHIPWACEAFSETHGPDLIQAPTLIWCWRLFMVKLWNHGLLDARTMNNCNITLEECQKRDKGSE